MEIFNCLKSLGEILIKNLDKKDLEIVKKVIFILQKEILTSIIQVNISASDALLFWKKLNENELDENLKISDFKTKRNHFKIRKKSKIENQVIAQKEVQEKNFENFLQNGILHKFVKKGEGFG